MKRITKKKHQRRSGDRSPLLRSTNKHKLSSQKGKGRSDSVRLNSSPNTKGYYSPLKKSKKKIHHDSQKTRQLSTVFKTSDKEFSTSETPNAKKLGDFVAGYRRSQMSLSQFRSTWRNATDQDVDALYMKIEKYLENDYHQRYQIKNRSNVDIANMWKIDENQKKKTRRTYSALGKRKMYS
jgi:hypothetical protein